MHSVFSTIALVAISLLSQTSAQVYPPYDPKTTPASLRYQWCVQQQASCDLLCLDQKSGNQYSNGCDPDTLVYECICGDGSLPNATEYSQTIPYFICMSQVQQCSNNCASSDCVSLCTDGKHCGASNPTRVNSSTITTTMSSTAAPSGSGSMSGNSDIAYTGLAGASRTRSGNPSSDATGAAATGNGTNNDLGLKSSAVSATIAFGEFYGIAFMTLTMFFTTFFFLH